MTENLDLLTIPGHLIRRLQQQSAAVFSERTAAAGFDLTAVQFATLVAMAQTPGLDQATLAKRIAYDRATIGGVIKRLVQKGLVSRQPDDKDRRAFKIGLTSEGATILAQIRPFILALQIDILPGLSEAERTILMDLITKTLNAKASG